MRDLHYNSGQTDVTSISKILGVGIPNNNSIHHITRHGRDNLLLGIARQILHTKQNRFCRLLNVYRIFFFRKGCSFSIYVASTTAFSQ